MTSFTTSPFCTFSTASLYFLISSSLSFPSALSVLNSKSGVCPIISTAFDTSVTPGKSTISRWSSVARAPPFWICTFGSETPKRFTRRSTISRSAFIEFSTSPFSTRETSARYTKCVPPERSSPSRNFFVCIQESEVEIISDAYTK